MRDFHVADDQYFCRLILNSVLLLLMRKFFFIDFLEPYALNQLTAVRYEGCCPKIHAGKKLEVIEYLELQACIFFLARFSRRYKLHNILPILTHSRYLPYVSK